MLKPALQALIAFAFIQFAMVMLITRVIPAALAHQWPTISRLGLAVSSWRRRVAVRRWYLRRAPIWGKARVRLEFEQRSGARPSSESYRLQQALMTAPPVGSTDLALPLPLALSSSPAGTTSA
jgi:hypothetical protein